jgi:hypothetical protein
MAWLALAMKPHWAQVSETPYDPAVARKLRVLGSTALLLSLGACLVVDHASMASLVWTMTLSASALVVAIILAYRPRWLGRLVAPLQNVQ